MAPRESEAPRSRSGSCDFVGLCVAVGPVWWDWKSTQKSAEQYDVAIDDLQYAIQTTPALNRNDVPPLPKGYTLVPSKVVTIPDTVLNWLRPPDHADEFDKYRVKDRLSFPETMSDAEIMRAFKENLLLARPTFSFRSAVRIHAWVVLGGVALFASGLSIFGWLFRRRSTERVAS